jgi:hypothetical protein
MYSLAFLVVELQNPRRKLLRVFQIPNNTQRPMHWGGIDRVSTFSNNENSETNSYQSHPSTNPDICSDVLDGVRCLFRCQRNGANACDRSLSKCCDGKAANGRQCNDRP